MVSARHGRWRWGSSSHLNKALRSAPASFAAIHLPRNGTCRLRNPYSAACYARTRFRKAGFAWLQNSYYRPTGSPVCAPHSKGQRPDTLEPMATAPGSFAAIHLPRNGTFRLRNPYNTACYARARLPKAGFAPLPVGRSTGRRTPTACLPDLRCAHHIQRAKGPIHRSAWQRHGLHTGAFRAG